jgi:hypothetical protein
LCFSNDVVLLQEAAAAALLCVLCVPHAAQQLPEPQMEGQRNSRLASCKMQATVQPDSALLLTSPLHS